MLKRILFFWCLCAAAAFAQSHQNNLQIYNTVSSHWTIGKSKFVNVGDQSVLGYASGAFTVVLDSANPTATPLTSWQVGAPYTNPCDAQGVWYPGDAKPPCNFAAAYDSHTAFWHDPADDDMGPVCGTVYNYATLAPPPVAPYQGEEVCISTNPSWSVSREIGAYKVWRFTHTFNTGGSAFFDTQFAISELSQDGKFLAFSSDWDCTLGDTAGGGTSHCGPPWVAGTTYSVGQMINPFGATTGSGTNYGLYQVTTGGVAAATKPAWFVCNSTTAGNTVTDANGLVYTCMGANNGKGEVFIVGLK